eukprot:COSAG06_NODE_1535_length_9155_cov_68.266343_3_plen_236_part_00
MPDRNSKVALGRRVWLATLADMWSSDDDVFPEPPVAAQPAPAPTPTAADDDDTPPTDAPLPLGDDDEFPDDGLIRAAEVAAENASLWLELTDIDEVLVNICRFLGVRELGRLACVARRFTEPTLTGGAKLLSPIEEGARLRLAAAGVAAVPPAGKTGGGASGVVAAVRLAGDTWMRALWRVESRLLFTSCGPEVVLSEEGALRLRAAGKAATSRCLGGRLLGHPRRLAFTQELAA